MILEKSLEIPIWRIMMIVMFYQYLITDNIVSHLCQASRNVFYCFSFFVEKAFSELSFATKNFEIHSLLNEKE